MPRPHPAATVVTGVLIASILALTLSPATVPRDLSIDRLCLVCGERGVADLIENVLLYAPLGIAFHALGLRPLYAAAAALAISGTIEVIQLGVPGRYATVRDALSNSAGAGLGALAAKTASRLARSPTHAYWRSLATAAFASAIVAGSGWLQHPRSTSLDYFGQWAPRFGHLVPWEGSLREVTVGDVEVPHGLLWSSNAVRDLLEEGAPIRILGTLGPHTRDLGAIFMITDQNYRQILLVGAERDDLVLRFRRRADAWRLDGPSVRYPDLFSEVGSGPEFTLTITSLGDHACATLGAAAACAPGLAAGSAWTLLRPSASQWIYPSILDAATIMLLALPLGLTLFGVPRSRAVLTVIVFGSGVAISAAAAGLRLPMPIEWLGMAGGLGLGLLIVKATAR